MENVKKYQVVRGEIFRGELCPVGQPETVTVPGANHWDAIERHWISQGWEYSARKTVRNYDPPYAIIMKPGIGDWLALYPVHEATP